MLGIYEKDKNGDARLTETGAAFDSYLSGKLSQMLSM